MQLQVLVSAHSMSAAVEEGSVQSGFTLEKHEHERLQNATKVEEGFVFCI